MTAPRAAKSGKFGQRYYPVPHPTTKELHDLPAFSTLKKLVAAPALETWKLKGVAKQVALTPSLQMLAADDATVYEAVKAALNATRDKADTGTGVHNYCDIVDKLAPGVAPDLTLVPVAARPYLDAYNAAKAEIGWTIVESEVTVANFEIGYACTPDRFVDYPGLGVVNADIKTGKDVWPDTAWQLAAGANGECIWTAPTDADLPEFAAALAALEADIADGRNMPPTATGRASKKWSEAAKKRARDDLDELRWAEFARFAGHRPMPEGIRTDVAVVFHLTPGECVPVLLHLDTETPAIEVMRAMRTLYGWKACEPAVLAPRSDTVAPEPAAEIAPTGAVHDAAVGDEGGGAATVGGADPAPTIDERREYLRARVLWTSKASEAAGAALISAWPQGVPRIGEADAGQLDAIEAHVEAVDRSHEVPFAHFTADDYRAAHTLDAAQAIVAAAFPGANDVDTAHRRDVLSKRTQTLAARHPGSAKAFVESLERVGIAKSLSTASWTLGELDNFEALLGKAEQSSDFVEASL